MKAANKENLNSFSFVNKIFFNLLICPFGVLNTKKQIKTVEKKLFLTKPTPPTYKKFFF